MIRGITIISGFGLVALWIVGLSSVDASGWLTWLDGIAALYAFAIAGGIPGGVRASTQATRSARPIVLAIGLYALWVIALSTNVVAWQSWWTFAFASVFMVLGIASATMKQIPGRITSEEEFPSNESFRKSA